MEGARYKLNTLNSKHKEVWKYCRKVETAFKWRNHSSKYGLFSVIYEYVNGKWEPVNNQ